VQPSRSRDDGVVSLEKSSSIVLTTFGMKIRRSVSVSLAFVLRGQSMSGGVISLGDLLFPS